MRFTLRDLPLPAKLVVSIFMLAVGLGYFSALVQLHLQHSSRNGEHLPTGDDVVAVFAGKKKHDPNTPKPVSKLERLVMGPIDDSMPWNGNGSMGAAFFTRSSDYKVLRRTPNEHLDEEREGERKSMQAWIQMKDEERKAAYMTDSIPKPDSIKHLTAEFIANNTVKIKSILTERCVRCHARGESQEEFPLETYEQISKYLEVPKCDEPDARGWVLSEKQMSVEKLTQSTHAHLLSFALLFGATGMLFAFTNYAGIIRFLVAPLVLLAQVCDIACWWLARLPEFGPYFAYAIIGTGSVVGLGLIIQILGVLFDLFSTKGKAILVLILIAGSFGLGTVYFKAIEPALAAQRK